MGLTETNFVRTVYRSACVSCLQENPRGIYVAVVRFASAWVGIAAKLALTKNALLAETTRRRSRKLRYDLRKLPLRVSVRN